jgi:cell pole-organizing protein PopZ
MPGREPSMEDILASIKKVIAEEKELRGAGQVTAPLVRPAIEEGALQPEPPQQPQQPEVLELDEPVIEDMHLPTVDLGPPLVSDDAAEASRARLAALSQAAAAAPPPPAVNPLEQMVRDMLRPMLKDWLDQHLPGIVDEHVKREIGRITGQTL